VEDGSPEDFAFSSTASTIDLRNAGDARLSEVKSAITIIPSRAELLISARTASSEVPFEMGSI